MLNINALTDPRLSTITIKPQGGYFAGECLKQVSNDHDPFYDPTLRADNDAFTEMLMDGGIVFESEVGDSLKSLFKDDESMVFIPACDRTVESKKAREAATMQAMNNGAKFIWNARLPASENRISEPDWLERVGDAPKPNGKWAYIPGDVKHSMTIKGTAPATNWLAQSLSSDGFEMATASFEEEGKPVPKHDKQLAHYYFHLTSLGYNVEEGQIWGAIYGKEDIRIYRDISEPIYMHLDRSTGFRRRMSALEIYVQEFDLRVLIAKASSLRLYDEKPVVGPQVCGPRCTCPWRVVSAEELEESDSIVLLQKVTYKVAVPLLAQKINTRAELARLDWKTAFLNDSDLDVAELVLNANKALPNSSAKDLLTAKVVGRERPDAVAKAVEAAAVILSRAGIVKASDILTLDKKTDSLVAIRNVARVVNLKELIKLAGDFGVSPYTPVEDLLTPEVLGKETDKAINKASEIAKPFLAKAGIATAEDVLKIDLNKVSMTSNLARLIDQARVTKAGRVCRARGVDYVLLPTGAIQMDIDMENDDLIYLWGCRSYIKKKNVITTEYKPFVSWDGTDEGEAQAFVDFWTYLMKVKNNAEKNHEGAFRAYHYTPAEDRCMKHLVKKHVGFPGMPSMEELEAFLNGDSWVDMFTVIKNQTLWPTPNMSLKAIAKWIRFSWREQGANGSASINWYRDATSALTDPVERESIRAKILEYNEDDVTATFELREWLGRLGTARRAGIKLPAVEDLEAKFRRHRAAPGVTASELDSANVRGTRQVKPKKVPIVKEISTSS